MYLEADFAETLWAVLKAHPAGLSEYDLIRALRERGGTAFVRHSLREPLALFRTHFLLFHALYALRERWRRSGLADLHIGVQCIRLQAYAPGRPALAVRDPLREYYLDPEPLRATTAAEAAALLARFTRIEEARRRRGEALATLGLSDPVDEASVKRAYRRLAMALHPDRGGDTAALQTLTAAMAALSRGRTRGR